MSDELLDDDVVDYELVEWDDNEEDMNIQTVYCKHGTYIGTWDGPDYMCNFCENGE